MYYTTKNQKNLDRKTKTAAQNKQRHVLKTGYKALNRSYLADRILRWTRLGSSVGH